MGNTAKHIDGDELRDLYERSGLSVSQFARLYGTHERPMIAAFRGAGVQGEAKVEQHGRISKVIAEIEAEGIRELTPLVAFNSPKLPEFVRAALLRSSGDRSPFHRLLSEVVRPQQIQFQALTAREQLGVS